MDIAPPLDISGITEVTLLPCTLESLCLKWLPVNVCLDFTNFCNFNYLSFSYQMFVFIYAPVGAVPTEARRRTPVFPGAGVRGGGGEFDMGAGN